jgi:hypothetical protein
MHNDNPETDPGVAKVAAHGGPLPRGSPAQAARRFACLRPKSHALNATTPTTTVGNEFRKVLPMNKSTSHRGIGGKTLMLVSLVFFIFVASIACMAWMVRVSPE